MKSPNDRKPKDTPRASVPHGDPPASPETAGLDLWPDVCNDLKVLASEQDGMLENEKLCVYRNLNHSSKDWGLNSTAADFGNHDKWHWTISKGPDQSFRDRFTALATRAARHTCSLYAPVFAPQFLVVWLDRLHGHLQKNNSPLLLAEGNVETIKNACEASVSYCSWIENGEREKERKEVERLETKRKEAERRKAAALESHSMPKHAVQAGPTAGAAKGYSGLGQKKTKLNLDGASLTGRQHDCISMRSEYGLSLTEIGRRLGINRSTVEEHLAAANKRLERDQSFQRRRKRRASRGGTDDE